MEDTRHLKGILIEGNFYFNYGLKLLILIKERENDAFYILRNYFPQEHILRILEDLFYHELIIIKTLKVENIQISNFLLNISLTGKGEELLKKITQLDIEYLNRF